MLLLLDYDEYEWDWTYQAGVRLIAPSSERLMNARERRGSCPAGGGPLQESSRKR